MGGSVLIQKTKREIVSDLMVIHTDREKICIRDIRNRRFMFDPQKEVLILGKQYRQGKLVSSHAQELADAGITAQYDNFVRGWIGTGKSDPHGVIHFAPHIPVENITLFDRGFNTLQMFAENGATAQTLIRGFGHQWEQPMASILPENGNDRRKNLSIEKITTEDLRRMEDKEGLVLQGCGGDPQEWLDGINNMFYENGILLNGSKFENIQVFQKDGSINILYPFEDVQLDLGKLAMWRLRSHDTFGGTWLSDYVPNALGGFLSAKPQLPQKPDCALIGQDGNVFNLVGIVSRMLREHGQQEQAMELTRRVFASDSYGKALSVIGEYVNITSVDEPVRSSIRDSLRNTVSEKSVPKPKAVREPER